MNKKVENDFFHHLRDTIILLGGSSKIANLVVNREKITEGDVSDLRKANSSLLDRTKYKLASINTIKINTDNLE